MTVKELRNWLVGFEKKNKNHFHQGSARQQKQDHRHDQLLIARSNGSSSPSKDDESRDFYESKMKHQAIELPRVMQDETEVRDGYPEAMSDTRNDFSSAADDARTKTIPSANPTEVVTEHDQPNTSKVLRRKKFLDPKDLPFLQGEPVEKAREPEEEKEEKPQSSVTSGILMFGGAAARKTIVQRRKDQLQKLFDASKTVKHVKKTKWGACHTGTYKKKVIIDVNTKWHHNGLPQTGQTASLLS